MVKVTMEIFKLKFYWSEAQQIMLPFTLTWRKLFVVLLGDRRGHYLAQ